MVVVLGTGFVGTAIARRLARDGREHRLLSRSRVNYTDPAALARWLDAHPAEMLLNAAGWNGRNVDDVERDPERSREANVALPERLARECAARGIAFVHLSTGCVFHGRGPFHEDDEPNFLKTVYARHKLEAERRVLGVADAWIFRLRLAFSGIDHPRNLLTKLRGYPKILPGIQSATWLEDFAMQWSQVVRAAPPGIYHAVQPGPLDVVSVARALGNPAPIWEPEEFREAGHAPRSECVLGTAKYEAASGGAVPDGASGVAASIASMARNPDATIQ